MREMPVASVYEEVYQSMPWGRMPPTVLRAIESQIPENGTVMDLMCGTGHLLRVIKQARPDLHVKGIDVNKEYIEEARKRFGGEHAWLKQADVRFEEWMYPFDCTLCTAGVHHLLFDEQEGFIERIAWLTKRNGICVVAEPCIRDHTTEKDRLRAALELGTAYLSAVIEMDGIPSIIAEGADVLKADLLLTGEYKRTRRWHEEQLTLAFGRPPEVIQMWPDEPSEFGDFCFVCRHR